MGLELTPQGTDVPGSSVSSSLLDGTLCILLAQHVLSFVKLSLYLEHLGRLLLQLTLQLSCPEDSTGSIASSKEKQQRKKKALARKRSWSYVAVRPDGELDMGSQILQKLM